MKYNRPNTAFLFEIVITFLSVLHIRNTYVIDSFNLKRELQKLQSCNDYSVIFIDHYRFYKSLKRNNIHSIFLSMDVHLFSNSLFNSLNAKVVSYWNQATDLPSKLIDWFLYGGNVGL